MNENGQILVFPHIVKNKYYPTQYHMIVILFWEVEAEESQIWSWPGWHSETPNTHIVGGDTKPLRYRGKSFALNMCNRIFLAYKRKLYWKTCPLILCTQIIALPSSQTPIVLSDVFILTWGFLQGWLVLSRVFRDCFHFSFFLFHKSPTLLNFKHCFKKIKLALKPLRRGECPRKVTTECMITTLNVSLVN